MSLRPLLSIAIPTYNRANYLRETIEALSQQVSVAAKNIEIIVLDNCSSDDTIQVCENALRKWQFVKVLRNPENIGAESNVVQAMRRAAGEWIWLFGDDDIVLSGAVDTLFNYLKSVSEDTSLLLFNYGQVDKDGATVLSSGVCNAPHDWQGHLADFFDYKGSFDILGFISALVMKNDVVNYANNYEIFGSYYAHVGYLIQSFYFKNAVFCATPIINQRQNNQRISEEFGVLERSYSHAIETFAGIVVVLRTAAKQLDISMEQLERLQSKLELVDLSKTTSVPMLEWAFVSFVRNDLLQMLRNKGLDAEKISLLQKTAVLIASPGLRKRIDKAVSAAVEVALAYVALEQA